MNEDKIANQLKQYQELGKQDKNIDVAALAMATFKEQEGNQLTGKDKKWGYLISISLPPFGLLYALKFYTSGKSDGKSAAYMCLVLTVVSIVLFFILGGSLLSGSGTSVDQINAIKPSDIQQLLQ